MDTLKYQYNLGVFIKLGLPTTKAIACLEGEEVNLADVFLLFHAVIHETIQGLQKIKLPTEVQSEVIGILNTRYRQLFEAGQSEVYRAATFLHPSTYSFATVTHSSRLTWMLHRPPSVRFIQS